MSFLNPVWVFFSKKALSHFVTLNGGKIEMNWIKINVVLDLLDLINHKSYDRPFQWSISWSLFVACWSAESLVQEGFCPKILCPKMNCNKRMPQTGVGRMQGSNEGCLPLKVIFHLRSSSTAGCLSPIVVFQQRSSSTEGGLPLKVVFHQRLSSTKGCLPPKAVSTGSHLPLRVVFYWSLSSTKSCLPPKVVFHLP